MSIRALLIANRGEIAIRIARSAAELGIRTVSVFAADDAASLHTRKTDDRRRLDGQGAAAYLDGEQLVAVARQAGCDAIHPGYGFLSENAGFARRCAEAGLRFVGPRPDVLALFGDKVQARALAKRCGVPLLPGTFGPTSVEEVRQFVRALGPGGAAMIKALGGGGGRGIRAVHDPDEVADAYARCQSEARAAFGDDALYVEELIRQARHVEVQIAGDGSGRVVHLWERECSLQRRHQKLVEIAPSPSLPAALRERILAAAVTLAEAARYDTLGTFEFLVDDRAMDGAVRFAFMEANPRLQVEHTVTEAVLGLDLVKLQLDLAAGATLEELGLEQDRVPAPHGFAIQLRVNVETMDTNGGALPAGGTLTAFEPPSGPGIRVDTCGYAGYTIHPGFDSLLAKVIAHAGSSHADAVRKAYRALCEFRIDGVATNLPFLRALARHPDVLANRIHTRFVEEHAAALVAASGEPHPRLHFGADDEERPVGSSGSRPVATNGVAGPAGTVPVRAPLLGTVVSVDVSAGDAVRRGQQIAVLEAMKMEHLVTADTSGIVRLVAVGLRETVMPGHPLVFVEPAEIAAAEVEDGEAVDLDAIRPDLEEVRARHDLGLDPARPEAVGRRRRTGQRTARENIDDLCDPGTFIEYGALAIAAQRSRRPVDELIRMTPADGMIAGVGRVNGALFDESRSRCLVVAYDYTVLAGTQGFMNHKKKDRVFRLAEQWRLPVVLFAEGGGGRPGDTDWPSPAGLDVLTFHTFAKLSGSMPLVGIVSGRCFAGNAALLGCCDVIIATRDTTLGMGGPAMIEGGGLGVYQPDEVGPIAVQVPNGVVDLLVEDEAAAVRAARRYLSYFQGPIAEWTCADQRLLRRAIPENRLRVYDVRRVIETLADAGSVLELRPEFGIGMVTALIRIEGRPMGLIANNSKHLGGAIDAPAADKAARFVQLCDAFDLPILSLCDTPGFMVGPEAEKTALVRHVSRMFVNAANVTVPFFFVVLRKGYGLGAQSMGGGSFHAPFFSVAWPTGEFGGMGLEGAVRLGYRKELEAVADPKERQALYERMVAREYERGKALSMASFLEIDEVIDPMDTRRWILRGLASVPPPRPRDGKKRPCVDTW